MFRLKFQSGPGDLLLDPTQPDILHIKVHGTPDGALVRNLREVSGDDEESDVEGVIMPIPCVGCYELSRTRKRAAAAITELGNSDTHSKDHLEQCTGPKRLGLTTFFVHGLEKSFQIQISTGRSVALKKLHIGSKVFVGIFHQNVCMFYVHFLSKGSGVPLGALNELGALDRVYWVDVWW